MYEVVIIFMDTLHLTRLSNFILLLFLKNLIFYLFKSDIPGYTYALLLYFKYGML